MNAYGYPYIVFGLLTMLIFFSWRFISEGQWWQILGISVFLSLTCNTRSLFPMPWAIVFFLVIFFLGYAGAGRPFLLSVARPIVGAGILMLVLVSAWPLKNYIIFGRFTYSSWVGYNLARNTGIKNNDLNSFLRSDVLTDKIRLEVERFIEKYGASRSAVVSDIRKSDGSKNWNHLVFVRTGPSLSRRAIKWRFRNIGEWSKSALRYYIMWTRAGYTQPYTNEIIGPRSKIYRSLASVHRSVFFINIRFLFPDLFDRILAPIENSSEGAPIRVTIFGVLFLPLLLCLIPILVWRNWKNYPRKGVIVLLCWACIIWVLAVPCLTDGIEGNRMRFCTIPLFAILIGWCLSTFLKARRIRTSLLTRTPR
jgi:hypothetical protein